MATSSLYKTFALRTREETDIFMQKFEEHLKNPQPIEKTGVKMATEEDVERMIKILREQNGNNASE
ncbi:MAG: hypothetical protein J1D88_09120 [Treponema sp.]|nr:hypothetical protein [Treponema sp.]